MNRLNKGSLLQLTSVLFIVEETRVPRKIYTARPVIMFSKNAAYKDSATTFFYH